jgi:hypothetical protein
MLCMATSNITAKGIEAVRLGNAERGKTLLRQAVTQDPNDEQAWLWLSTVASNTAQQLDCLRHVLEINPFNHAARRDLAAIPPRYHYDAPPQVAAAFAASSSARASAAQRPASSAWNATPSVTASIPVATAQALRNDTVIGNGAAGAAKGSGTQTQPVPAVIIPAPTLLDPLDEQPRDPDYSPVQAVAARKFAQGVVRKKSVAVPHLGRIALGMTLFALIVLMILALLIDTTQRNNQATTVKPATQPTAAPGRATTAPRPTTTLDPSGRTFGTDATTSVDSARGALNVPGTAFVDGRVINATPPWTLDVIWVWAEPFETSHVQCKLPHGSAVLLLEAQTSPDGRRSVHIQRRDCAGWVSADLLSPTSVPPIGPVRSNDHGVTEK